MTEYADLITRSLAAIDGITPGPWIHHIGPEDETPSEYMRRMLRNDGEPLHVLVATSDDPHFTYVAPAITGDGPHSAKNADFIAAAPSLIADLVAALLHCDRESKILRDYIAERPRFITASKNCPPENTSDYWRWQGHAAARRQLAERLTELENS